MRLKIELNNPFWWVWAVTLVCIVAAVSGWTPGYSMFILLSMLQVVVFLGRERSLSAFPVQIRLFYFAWSLFGLWPSVRLVFYVLLLMGTAMFVFFGRCSISVVLKKMPWNRNRAPRMV